GDSDWIYQFPPDYSLAPGQTAVVVQSARRFVSSYLKTNTTADQAAEPSLTLADLDNFYNLPNSPLMFETTDSGNTASGASAPMPGVPKMIRRFESANHYTLNMTNDNE